MSHLLAIVFLFLAAVVGMADTGTAMGGDAPFRITTKRDDDKAEVKVEMGKATVLIHSPFGISEAVITRSGEDWPDVVAMRLKLKGLENLKIANGKVTLEAAVSSQNGKSRLWMDGKEGLPLNSKNPFWMEIRMIGKDGKPVKTIPLKDGYFEIQLPKALLEDNPKSITVNWIDFYR
jgi:hypothetical protein